MTADRLYFAQHGLAESKADNPERPLSQKGVDQTRAIAQHLSTLNIHISGIFHSNKLRAQQTAIEFCSILNVRKIVETKYLSPNDDIALIKPELTNNALYIGHLPHLDKLTSSLISGNEDSHIINFQNSAVACLIKNDESFTLDWYLTPSLTSL